MAYDEEETNVYNGQSREDLVDDDELSPEEEAFMKGYEEADEEEDKDIDEGEDKEDKED